MSGLTAVITITEAARLYDIKHDTVLKAIKAGKLPARQSVKTWLILRSDAEARWGGKVKG